jgi:hypothetical protein
MRRLLPFVLGLAILSAAPLPSLRPLTIRAQAALEVDAPKDKDSVRFAIIGDTGTGTKSQYEIGALMTKAREVFPFEFVILPYEELLSAKVPFYAALGNHDDPTQRYYKPFNMNGERFYTFKKGDARFFVLDSNYMDQPQMKWLQSELSSANDRWKIAYFHHPLYSSGGRHGSETDLRTQVEPLFIKYGIDIVFAGHEHFYERIKPQSGIYYFTVGGSAKLASGDIRKSPLTAAGFDRDFSFMLAELGKDDMQFQVVSRVGKRVDSGTLSLAADPKQRSEGSAPR